MERQFDKNRIKLNDDSRLWGRKMDETVIDFLCVLQTHSLSNSQKDITRYGCTDKAEIVKRCTRSLVKSMNYAKLIMPHVNFRLQVYDDHSDDKCIQTLKETLSTAKFETNLDHLETRGIMPSILKCYEHGYAHGKDLVYYAQDDYLFTESAIWEMIEEFLDASGKLGRWCCIYPFDDPWRYVHWNIVPVEIVLGKKRHWRRNYKTASCFMTHVDVIRKQWDLFEAMGKHEVNGEMEDNTINKLFSERGYTLLTPIPSLALHFQTDIEKDPYIDWKSWWDKHKDE